MSVDTVPTRPPAPPGPGPAAPSGRATSSGHPEVLLVATAALVVTMCLPLVRVFVGTAFLRPVLAAGLLSLGVSWVARRLSAGPVTTLVASGLAWALFVGLVFVPDTLRMGLLPTLESVGAGRDLWLRGMELIRTRPAPAFAEAGLLLLTTTGVWWVAHAVDGLVFRLQAPLRAIGMSLVLWSVPLTMARDDATAWLWAAPLLAAAAGLLLASGTTDLGRWGTQAPGRRPRHGPDHVTSIGTLIAALAIAAGAVLGGLLPGFEEPPFYEVGRLGGTTITTNPIVSIRASLVDQGAQPVARVRTPEPIYLRLTALDVYGEREEWTSEGIRGGPAGGRLPLETDLPASRELEVEVMAEGLDRAIIVPAPYHPRRLSGPASDRFQYDRRTATVTLAAGQVLESGDSYTVEAAIPAPPSEALTEGVPAEVDPRLVALPGNVPEEVHRLAEQIVDQAGATTPFDQALAIQNELRTWEYSLDPPQGHSSQAMLAFLESRVGYCEQYAGTMAVMLRTLGVPARVAVGYTPGDLLSDDGEVQEWQVTRANAHAWVEVLFPNVGWIAFEPTPRDDGNLLTPTAVNLAPSAIDAQSEPVAPPPAPGELQDPETLDELVPDIDDLGRGEAGADAPTSSEGGTGPSLLLGVLLALLAAALAAGLIVHRRKDIGDEHLPPSERVLRAGGRVRRVGSGLGRPVRPWETDREYLVRLAGPTPASRLLADASAKARYAPIIEAAEAAEAEQAARAITHGLLEPLPRWRRAAVSVWGPLAESVSQARTWFAAKSEDQQWPQAAERLSRLVRRRSRR